MYFERLVLEIHSNNAGWKVVKPPFVTGTSGVPQKFSFLATDESCFYGFDIYNDVSQEEVLRTYMKRMDTKALTVIISLSGRPRKEVAKMADQYGITILSPADIESFFSLDSIEQRAGARPVARISE
jgi:hypothetical protein